MELMTAAVAVAIVAVIIFLLLSDGDLSLRFSEKFGKRLGKFDERSYYWSSSVDKESRYLREIG
jgi:hypothetical protein